MGLRKLPIVLSSEQRAAQGVVGLHPLGLPPGLTAVQAAQAAQGQRPLAPLPNTISLSATELDEVIDGCSRIATAAAHTAQLCEQAAIAFRNEASTLQSCKHMFERFRRRI